MDEEIKVSVICTAYNHEKYIRKALDGFVMQETNFPFEVIIHDDASTDNTPIIIREYEEKYPDIIKPIYQTENQFSKGVTIAKEFIFPRIKGKYIASCEGDDYWTDKYKLQKQYNYMESHPECAICVHQATVYNCSNGTETLATNEDCDRDYSIDEIISGGGNLFATASSFTRDFVRLKRPDCFIVNGVGDYQLFMFGAMSGKCHYMADNMATYNCGTEGAWTCRVERNRQKRILLYLDMINMLKRVDAYYENKYHEAITGKILELEFRMYCSKGRLLQIIRKKYNRQYEQAIRRGERPIKECLAVKMPWLTRSGRKNYE